VIGLLSLGLSACSGGRPSGGSPDYSGYPDTPFTIKDASELIGGPVAQGRIGDVLLKNDRIRVIIQKPAKNAGLFSFGGVIIDADRVRSSGEGRDEFGSIFPLVNVEWTVNYYNYEVTNTGEEGGPKTLKAYGKIDVWDYIDLDFVSEVAQGAVGQTITFARRFDDRGDPFEVYDDLKGLSNEVVTEYKLEPGTNYVRMDTTFKNESDTEIKMPVGDIVNGSGEFNVLIPGLGFSPDLMSQAGGDTPALIYEGFEGVDVSYGYFYDLSQFADADGNRLTSGSLSYSGVTFVILGEGILKVLPLGAGSAPQINFVIPADSERTITRYLVVGDGTASSVLEAGMEALGVATRNIQGTVVGSDGNFVGGATVAVQKKSGGTIVTFKTDSSGKFFGKLPAGSDPFSTALGGGKYHIVVGKTGYHQNGTAIAGKCDPEDTEPSTSQINVKCTLGESGVVKLSGPVTEASSGQPVAARLTIVGEDPSPEGSGTGVFYDIVAHQKPFGIMDVQYITAKGTFGLSGLSNLSLEPGAYHFVFSHGTEYGAVEKDVTIEAGKTISIEAIVLPRVVATPGYISADFHLHNVVSPDSWVAPEKRVLAAAAEGMDVLQSSDHDYLFDYAPVIEKVTSLGLVPSGSIIGSIVGQEITPNHYGHVQAFPLTVDPESVTNGAIDWSASPLDEVGFMPDYCMGVADIISAITGFEGEQVIQINHISDSPTGLPVGAGWVTSRFYLESGAGPLSTFADPVERRLTPRTDGSPTFPIPYGASSLISEGFTASELMIGYDLHHTNSQFMKSTLPTWFNFLNLGMIITATGSSDSHDEYFNLLGLPRNFIASEIDPKDGKSGAIDRNAYARAINEHRVIVSAGPFVTVEAKGTDGASRGVGDTVSGTKVTLTIKAASPSWAWFDTIEVYANTEPVPIDDETGNAMSGTAANASDFYKPYHVPKYGYEPSQSYRLYDETLPTWKEENGVITAQVDATLDVGEDTWIVVLVRGTKETSGYRSLFPIVTNVLIDDAKKPANFDPLNLQAFHADPTNGAFAFALANPIFVDADADGKFTAKYVREGTSPLTP
jgi:hypothetical protein